MSSACFGQLVWDKKEQVFHPTAEDKNIVAEYTFHNSGNYAVTITAIRTSCGCTTAAPDKKVYAPGESGTIKVNFDFGTRTGPQDRTVTVQTSDSTAPVVTLTLYATIPQLMQISPYYLMWAMGEEPLPKTIYIKVVNPTPIKILNITCNNQKLQGELKTLKVGSEYIYVVTPPSTSEAIKATYEIETDFPEHKPRTFGLRRDQAYRYARTNSASASACPRPRADTCCCSWQLSHNSRPQLIA